MNLKSQDKEIAVFHHAMIEAVVEENHTGLIMHAMKDPVRPSADWTTRCTSRRSTCCESWIIIFPPHAEQLSWTG